MLTEFSPSEASSVKALELGNLRPQQRHAGGAVVAAESIGQQSSTEVAYPPSIHATLS